MKYSYGITTVPERFGDLLPRTLTSLKNAGFPSPRLFVDGLNRASSIPFDFPVSTWSEPKLGIFGTWYLALWELFLREPRAHRYIIFQDDVIAYKNLRTYLDKCKLPSKGYFNFYTHPETERDHCPPGYTGWYQAPKWGGGRGALALMFDFHVASKLLSCEFFVNSTHSPSKGHTYHDGRILKAMKLAGIDEYVHSPSLVQHTGGCVSTWKNGAPDAESFRGEDFDATGLILEGK